MDMPVENSSSAMRLAYSENTSFVSPFPSGYSGRNAALGGCGLFVNALTFPLVATSPRLNNGVKILILNLIINDMIFMSSLTVYGILKSSHRSDGDGCWAIVFLLLLPLVMSYIVILLTALINFMAVYSPLRFRSASKTKYICIALIIGWVYSTTVCMVCVGFHFPRGRACMPLAVIPRIGVSGIAISTMLCFGGVLSLNVYSIILTRRQKKRLPPHNIPPNPLASIQHQEERDSHTVGIQSLSRSLPKKGKKKLKNRISPLPPGSIFPSTSSSTYNASDPRISFSVVSSRKGQDRMSPSDIKTICDQTRGGRPTHRSSSRAPVNTDGDGADASMDIEPYQGHRVNGSSSTPREKLYLKVEITLIILTSWSCLLSAPFILYMIWLAAFTIDREEFASRSLGIASSSLILINCFCDPFFYAWRFIDWRLAYQKCKGLCI